MKDKIPFYNIVNMFFVGCVASTCAIVLFKDAIHINKDNLTLAKDWIGIISVLLVILMFEIGFVINRISSILVEPILIKFKIWPRDGYSIDISEISQSNPKFQSMITEINLMRSHIFIYFVSCIMSFFLRKMEFSIISFFLIIVFVFGGRKHNNKINTIRKEYNKQKKREQDTKLEAERKIREAEDNFMYI